MTCLATKRAVSLSCRLSFCKRVRAACCRARTARNALVAFWMLLAYPFTPPPSPSPSMKCCRARATHSAFVALFMRASAYPFDPPPSPCGLPSMKECASRRSRLSGGKPLYSGTDGAAAPPRSTARTLLFPGEPKDAGKMSDGAGADDEPAFSPGPCPRSGAAARAATACVHGCRPRKAVRVDVALR